MGAEFAQRRLSPRELTRVGALIEFTSRRVRENVDAGREIRDDGFFADPPRRRRASDEIAEEVAQVVQRQAQERKRSATSGTSLAIWRSSLRWIR